MAMSGLLLLRIDDDCQLLNTALKNKAFDAITVGQLRAARCENLFDKTIEIIDNQDIDRYPRFLETLKEEMHTPNQRQCLSCFGKDNRNILYHIMKNSCDTIPFIELASEMKVHRVDIGKVCDSDHVKFFKTIFGTKDNFGNTPLHNETLVHKASHKIDFLLIFLEATYAYRIAS